MGSTATKTKDGHEIVRISYYDVVTSIYMKIKFNPDIREKGFAGTIRNLNLDDRFAVRVFCIWNEKGQCVYTDGRGWGLYDFYGIYIN